MNYLTKLRNKRLLKVKLQRGKVKKEKLNKQSAYTLEIGVLIFGICFVICSVIYGYIFSPHVSLTYQPEIYAKYTIRQIVTARDWFIVFRSLRYGLSGAIFFSALYFFIPLFRFVYHWFKNFKLPPRTIFADFDTPYQVVSLLTISSTITYLLFFRPSVLHIRHLRYNGFDFSNALQIFPFFIITSLIIAFILMLLLLWLTPKHSGKYKASRLAKTQNYFGKASFGLYIGESTGVLTARHHGAGIAALQPVTLNLPDATQNIITYGGIGEGKTTALIYPLLLQLLDQNCGGLIFDIKGDFKHAVMKFAKMTQTEITSIGAKHQNLNLLQNLTPETAADYLRATLTLHGSGGGKEKHWLNAASSLACSILGILSFTPRFYTLEGLYKFLHKDDFRDDVLKALSDLQLENDKKRLLDHYVNQYDTVFTGTNERYQKDVVATMNEVLAHFAHPVFADAFCNTDGEAGPDMLDVLNGKVFLVDMPLHTWGMGGNTVYMFIKLRYFDAVKRRLSNPELDQNRPVFFMCDEYQRLVDRSDAQLNSDLNFWDTARAAKNIGIISTQSISSFYSAVGDDRITDAILQNFRQKICLKTEDKNTIDNFAYILGKVEVGKYSFARNEGSNTTDHNNTSKHKGSSESLSYGKESVVDAQLYRNLEPDQAVASLIINSRAMDDVLNLFPVRW